MLSYDFIALMTIFKLVPSFMEPNDSSWDTGYLCSQLPDVVFFYLMLLKYVSCDMNAVKLPFTTMSKENVQMSSWRE